MTSQDRAFQRQKTFDFRQDLDDIASDQGNEEIDALALSSREQQCIAEKTRRARLATRGKPSKYYINDVLASSLGCMDYGWLGAVYLFFE